jgi:hypothetical protein
MARKIKREGGKMFVETVTHSHLGYLFFSVSVSAYVSVSFFYPPLCGTLFY